MRLLFDTHLLLWLAVYHRQLSKAARRLLDDESNEFFFSSISFLEIGIKRALGRPDFCPEPNRLRQNLLARGFKELPLTSDQAMGIEFLPALHRNPFDRILIVQAAHEGMTLVTADRTIAKYPGAIRRV